jgi:hypothetical protein
MKKCSKCRIEKPLSEFWIYRKARGKTSGRPFARCKSCLKDQKSAWYAKNSESVATYNRSIRNKYPIDHLKSRLRRYAMKEDEFVYLIESQENKCAICQISLDITGRICIDHDYETGKVRSILCNKCNSGLGMFNDIPDLLRKAANYIEMHKVEVDKNVSV